MPQIDLLLSLPFLYLYTIAIECNFFRLYHIFCERLVPFTIPLFVAPVLRIQLLTIRCRHCHDSITLVKIHHTSPLDCASSSDNGLTTLAITEPASRDVIKPIMVLETDRRCTAF